MSVAELQNQVARLELMINELANQETQRSLLRKCLQLVDLWIASYEGDGKDPEGLRRLKGEIEVCLRS